MKEKIVVTGGAGFIGSHLVERLVRDGFDIHVVDNLIAGKREHVPPGATLHIIDIREKEKLSPIFKDADTIFHLAALPSVPYSIEYPIETHEVNVLGTLNVLMAARDAGVRRIVFSSSSAAYGDQQELPIYEYAPCEPKSPYGLQKLESELYMRLASELYGVGTVSLRYFNLYGPRQNATGPYASVIAKFLDQSACGEELTVVGDGEQTRDFIHVEDVVEANIAAMKSLHVGSGEVINIGGGIRCSINQIAEMIGGEVLHVPQRTEIKDSLAAIDQARDLLGWMPRKKFEDGIKELLMK